LCHAIDIAEGALKRPPMMFARYHILRNGYVVQSLKAKVRIPPSNRRENQMPRGPYCPPMTLHADATLGAKLLSAGGRLWQPKSFLSLKFIAEGNGMCNMGD
jgi:hypothetical protein